MQRDHTSAAEDLQVTLFQSCYEKNGNMKSFVGESLGAAILDSEASKIVCGQVGFHVTVIL